jgi:hypothetical protein
VLDGRAETMSAMDSFLITVDGSEHEISPSVVRACSAFPPASGWIWPVWTRRIT